MSVGVQPDCSRSESRLHRRGCRSPVANSAPLASIFKRNDTRHVELHARTDHIRPYRHRFAPLTLSRLPAFDSVICREGTEGTSRQGKSISKSSLNINTGRDPPFYRPTTLAFAVQRPHRHFSGHCRLGNTFTGPSKIPP